MRISEGLQLRVKDLDFDHGTIIVREGKGSKDRALMLPESLAPSLREQDRSVRLHEILAGLSDAKLAAWPASLAAEETERRRLKR